MDYEKKYKEALELARVAAFNGHQSLMEGIFPELKESEDERIRKAITEYLRQRLDRSPSIPAAIGSWIAWLEKQGEQSSLNINRECLKGIKRVQEYQDLSDWEKEFDKIASMYAHNKNQEGYNDSWYVKERAAEMLYYAKKELEKQGEQNTNHKTMIVNFLCKKDWHGIGDYCCGKIYNGYPCEKEQKGYDIYDDNHIPTFCDEDFINEYFNIVTEEKQDEQKPAWSEEDEKKIKDIIYFLDTAKKHYASTVELDACINWLKSLKQRYIWKPSDEQIGVIEAVINNRSFQRRHLDSLYEQLKKLKE